MPKRGRIVPALIPPEIDQRIDELAFQGDWSRSEVIRRAVDFYYREITAGRADLDDVDGTGENKPPRY